MKWNKYKIVCVLFLLFIISTGLSTAVFGARQIGHNMLVGYKDNYGQNSNILDKLRAMISGCEDGMNTEYVLKNQSITLYGAFQRLLDKKVVNDVETSNDVIKLNNEYLTFYMHQNENVESIVKKTTELNDFLKKQGVPLLYVQAPFKISKYDNKAPEGIKIYDNDIADEYLKGISKAGIDNIDLRELIKIDDIDHYSMFFKTDHHWIPKAGLWAFGKISKELNSHYEFNIDENIWNENNYNIKTYKEYFLGSQGKRTGIFYDGLDDFDIITPKFKTNFELNVDSQNINRKGNFQESLLDLNWLKKGDYFNTSPYNTYIGPNYGVVNIKNKNNSNGKKILLIRDSFSSVLAPFLAQGCSSLDLVDLRQADSINIEEYMKYNKPDIVIMMYTPDSLTKDTTFNFLQE